MTNTHLSNNPSVVQELSSTDFHGYKFSEIQINNIDAIRNADIEQIVNKNFTLFTYFNYFKNLCLTLFDFSNMLNIKNTVFNRMLFDFGRFAIVRTKDGDYALRQCVVTDYNEFGTANEINAWKYIPLGMSSESNEVENYKYDDFVIFNLNAEAIPLRYMTFFFVSKLVDVQLAIDNNVWQQQNPIICEATDEQKLALTNLFEKITNKIRVLFVKHSANLSQAISTLKLGGDYNADKGIEIKEEIKREFFTMLGIDHVPFEKKERLVADEVSSNDMLLEMSRNAMLNSLNESIKEAKEKGFELKITEVKYSVDINSNDGDNGGVSNGND